MPTTEARGLSPIVVDVLRTLHIEDGRALVPPGELQRAFERATAEPASEQRRIQVDLVVTLRRLHGANPTGFAGAIVQLSALASVLHTPTDKIAPNHTAAALALLGQAPSALPPSGPKTGLSLLERRGGKKK